MPSTVTLDSVCTVSSDVVARDIEGDLIIVPLVAGIGDMDDELYSLNETGRAVWMKLDGCHSLGEVVAELAEGFDADPGALERDVLGLVSELVQRNMVVAVATG